MKLPSVDHVDDHDGKPVAIQRFIGRRPIAAFGNSDGDQQMLEWTTAGDGPRLAGARSPHRRHSRVAIRPRLARRQVESRARRSRCKEMDRRQHEKTTGASSSTIEPQSPPAGLRITHRKPMWHVAVSIICG